MKLLIAVVNRQDYRGLQDALVEAGYRFTEVASSGGFLREGNVTLLIGVEGERVDGVLDLMRRHCRSREQAVNVAPPDTRTLAQPVAEAMTVPVGGAQVFILDVERVVRL